MIYKINIKDGFSSDSQEVVDLAVSGHVGDAEDDAIAGRRRAALRERPVEILGAILFPIVAALLNIYIYNVIKGWMIGCVIPHCNLQVQHISFDTCKFET